MMQEEESATGGRNGWEQELGRGQYPQHADEDDKQNSNSNSSNSSGNKEKNRRAAAAPQQKQ